MKYSLKLLDMQQLFFLIKEYLFKLLKILLFLNFMRNFQHFFLSARISPADYKSHD